MISKRRAWAVVIGLLAVAVGVSLYFLSERGPSRRYRLSDGSILEVENVSYGVRGPFELGGRLLKAKLQLAKVLPKSWAARLAPRTGNKNTWQGSYSAYYTNEPTFHVWITRKSSALGNYQNVDVQFAEVVDEDGCAFGAVTRGGQDNGLLPAPTNSTNIRTARGFSSVSGPALGSSVMWFSFDVFPRHDKELKLRFFDTSRRLMAEIKVANPAPAPSGTSGPRLPISVTTGDVEISLTAAQARTNLPVRPPGAMPLGDMVSSFREAEFIFEVLENGIVSTNWEPIFMELKDGAGNLAPVRSAPPLALCPREPEWILKTMFAAREASPTKSNSLWKINGLAVPEPGTTVEVATNFQLQGLQVKLIGLGGLGTFAYSGGKVTSATRETGSRSGFSSSSSSSFGISRSMSSQTLNVPFPHLAVMLGALGEQRLTVLVTDDQGRQTYGSEMGAAMMAPPSLRGIRTNKIYYLGGSTPAMGGPPSSVPSPITFLLLDLAPDAKTVDLTFCLHNPIEVEFKFKPEGK